MFKSAAELLRIAHDDPCWKNLKLWSWANDFDAQVTEWSHIIPPVTDDRRIFINTYSQVYTALTSMQRDPDS